MLRIRVVKTASGANAVQVVYYKNGKRIIFKHIGSASSSNELESLKLVAKDVIKNFDPEIPFLKRRSLIIFCIWTRPSFWECILLFSMR